MNSREIYNDLYQNGYPNGSPGLALTWAGIDPNTTRTILDVGCGSGLLANRFPEYYGIDISDYIIEQNKRRFKRGHFFACDIVDMPKVVGEINFDLVVAMDVLEHIYPGNLTKALTAISGVHTQMFLFSICCRKSAILSRDGRNLHPTIMGRSGWLALLDRYMGVAGYSILNKQQTFYVKALPNEDTIIEAWNRRTQ